MSASPVINVAEDTVEDLITLSPARSSCPKNAQKEDEPSFVDKWWDNIKKNRANNIAGLEKIFANNAASRDDSADEDSSLDDEHDKLLNPTPAPRPRRTEETPLTGSPSSQSSSASSVVRQVPLADPFVSSPPRTLPASTAASTPTGSESPVLPHRRASGRVVTIYHLPLDITMRDILSRISTGKIRNATLCSMSRQPVAGMCAVITFDEPRSASECVHVGQAYPTIWQFPSTGDCSDVRQARVVYIPTLVTGQFLHHPDEIPLALPPFVYNEDATRCLAIENCAFDMVPQIWNALRLPFHLRSPHYTSSVEDIWVDGFQRNRDGRIEYANLHIWYTCTEMAIGARSSIYPRAWATCMTYEKDPCDSSQSYDIFFRPDNNPGFSWHSMPSQSLLDVHKAGRIDELFARWRAISDAVKEARAPPIKPGEEARKVPPTPEEIQRDMAARHRAARENKGIDPVTLTYANPNDYDSDDEGGRRRAPLIDARQLTTERAAKRRAHAKKPLLVRDAYVDALVAITAARPPATTGYSPGTRTAVPLVCRELDEKAVATPINAAVSSSLQPSNKTAAPKPEAWDYMRDPEPLRQALKASTPTYYDEVSLEEYKACSDAQRRALGTRFYVPPEGHNSLDRQPW